MMISRRSLALVIGSMPLLARAAVSQTAIQARRVGLLSSAAPLTDSTPMVTGLTAGFTKRGYVVGSTLIFERRAAEAHPDRLPPLVDDLKSKAEIIITNSYAAARVVKDRSKVPVVAVTGADPVATGLIDSLARPGGTITGVGEVAAELSAKRLEVLKDTFPSVRKIAMLWNADDLGMTLRYKSAETAARILGLEVQALGVREPEDFGAAFAAMARDRPDAILMVTDALMALNRKRVFEFAAEQKLPAIYEYEYLVRDGGLMSYGPDMSEVYDRAADLADRILKGARPADLPFEQPTHFRLVINKKAAETLGITIPGAILVRADEVIE
jgi:putative tryptophan/tyrosine transport system substrate-binding protein